MGELVRLIIEIVQLLWPFRMVEQWQRGNYYVCGRYWRTVGPGVYPVLPWFMNVIEEDVVGGIEYTPRKDITLQDGSLLTFEMSAWARVADLNLAINAVQKFRESTVEAMTGVACEKLAEVEADRLKPAGRGRLLADLKRWMNAETTGFGVELTSLRFTTFVLNAPAYRVLQDSRAGAL